MRSNRNSSSCGCGGCLGVIVIGTALVGTLAIGGCSKAFHKVQSIWDYDSKLQTVQKAFDENGNGTLDNSERLNMYGALNIPTINGQIPSIKIPYEELLIYEKKHGQDL